MTTGSAKYGYKKEKARKEQHKRQKFLRKRRKISRDYGI
jgi:hypothetical protein